MLENPPSRIIYPLLPFAHDISYFMININEEKTLNLNSIQSEKNTSSSETEIDYANINLLSNTNLDIHKKKSPVTLKPAAINFKFAFYRLLTSRKKFPKKYVVLIHNYICNTLKLRRVNRDESRSIDLYFNSFCKYQEQIISYIQLHKLEILSMFPELLDCNI